MAKNKLKIAIISGGLSNEREISVKTGEQVFKNLSNTKFDKHLIEISKDGRWLLKNKNLKLGNKVNTKVLSIIGQNKTIAKNDLKSYDVVFIALHGKYGEDGKTQSILDILGIPYTGSGVLASALGMNKAKTMEFLQTLKIKTPKFILLSNKNKYKYKLLDKLIKKDIKYPCVIKPNKSGSSIGISIIQSVKELKNAVDEAFKEDKEVLIEEFIQGREIACGVLGNSNQMKLEALPPVEIITKNTFFDYEAKYFSKKTQEICPAHITNKLTKEVQILAKKVHQSLGCDGLTRSDFILKKGEFYFLEINTLPGLTEQSLCPKEAKAAGITFSELLNKITKLALKK